MMATTVPAGNPDGDGRGSRVAVGEVTGEGRGVAVGTGVDVEGGTSVATDVGTKVAVSVGMSVAVGGSGVSTVKLPSSRLMRIS